MGGKPKSDSLEAGPGGRRIQMKRHQRFLKWRPRIDRGNNVIIYLFILFVNWNVTLRQYMKIPTNLLELSSKLVPPFIAARKGCISKDSLEWRPMISKPPLSGALNLLQLLLCTLGSKSCLPLYYNNTCTHAILKIFSLLKHLINIDLKSHCLTRLYRLQGFAGAKVHITVNQRHFDLL